MRKKILLLLFLFNLHVFASSVLIVNSYHKGYEWSDKIIDGIEKSFYAQKNVDINVLYMDSKWVTSQEYYESLSQLYEVQYQNRKYDLIIAVDRFAYDFVLRIYHRFFTKEPILAVGLENYSQLNAQKYNVEDRVSVLLEHRDLMANVKLAEQMIPDIKKLYIINDKSLNAQHTEPLIQELLNDFKGTYDLEYLQANSLEELNKKFRVKKENEAILFVRFYKNSDGKLNKNVDIASFIDTAQLPVFITDSIFLKKGATAGKIVDLKAFGEYSGHMASDILKNKGHTIKVYDELYYFFDALKLENSSFDITSFTHAYKLVNRRTTFYDEYRVLITIISTLFPFLLILLAILAHNIYTRKKVEKQLREHIEFDSVLLNAIESPIFWQNKDGIIVDSNSKFCKLIGMNALDIYGHALKDFKANEKVADVIKIIKKYQKTSDKNIFYKIKKEDITHIYLMKQATYQDTVSKISGVVTIFHDVTHEKMIEIERERNQQFIIQQTKLAEIGEIFSSIAHQWKAPLVEITAIAQENFYAQYQKNNEDESYVNEIMTQVKYMNDTINDFQEFIMPSHQKIVFDVYEAITSMLDIVSHNIKYNYLQINIDLKEGTNTKVLGYRNEFMQSFLNIINNAKDELIKQDLKNRHIDISIYNQNKKVCIVIQDNAGGIKEEYLHKLFKPYFSTKEDGHGIGLYMTKMIIEDKMDGKIFVENRNDGARFTIELGQK
jgi:PAS domain S-box-containing protein